MPELFPMPTLSRRFLVLQRRVILQDNSCTHFEAGNERVRVSHDERSVAGEEDPSVFFITRRCNTSGARRYTGHVTASGPTPTRTFTLWSLTREATGARWLSSPAGRRLNCCFSRNSFAILVTRQATSQSWGCSSTGRALQWH